MPSFLRLFLTVLGFASAPLCSAESLKLSESLSPYFLADESTPLPRGFPWGDATVANRDPTRPPTTGVTRYHEWTITRGIISPDGVEKSAILVNGQFPGPTLEANWGDTFHITVHNQIEDDEDGTLLHWHGLLHRGAPWYDGVPAVDMCPIAPGKSFTYVFKADQYGSSWWHSHYSAQLADGLWGPMIIYGPRHVHYDVDLGPITLTSHYHTPYRILMDDVMGIPSKIAFTDNNLINGKMFFDCDRLNGTIPCTPNHDIAKFDFRPGKKYLLRLVNTSPEGTQHFSLDGHKLTIISNDYVEVWPYSVDFVTLAVGQRSDVIVEATGKPGDSYFMRANISGICDPINLGEAVAGVYYPAADKSKLPNSKPAEYDLDTCTNDALDLTVPIYKTKPPAQPATEKIINLDIGFNSTGHRLFSMNDVSYRGNYDHPVLLLSKLGNTSYPDDPQWNVYNFGSNSSVRIVLYNRTPLYHPIHLHGHNFWVLAEGMGEWDGTVVNPENPQRRDVQTMRASNGVFGVDPNPEPGYLVIEFEQDNPGIWPLHCHIAWHVSVGLFINVMERPDEIRELDMPASVAQTCRDWAYYSNHTVVDQIDSGL